MRCGTSAVSVKSLGYFGVWGIILAESGLLIGFFLPGDSLLFTAGFLASLPKSELNIWVLIFGAFVCAVLGDNVGYATGHKFGRFPNSRLGRTRKPGESARINVADQSVKAR